MFGLFERSLIAEYEDLLWQTKRDAAGIFPFAHNLCFGTAFSFFVGSVDTACGYRGALRIQTTLEDTVANIPSEHLPAIDDIMSRALKTSGYNLRSPTYQLSALLHGLIYVRTVDGSAPRLSRRAFAFRDSALDFLELFFALVMQSRETPQEESELKNNDPSDADKKSHVGHADCPNGPQRGVETRTDKSDPVVAHGNNRKGDVSKALAFLNLEIGPAGDKIEKEVAALGFVPPAANDDTKFCSDAAILFIRAVMDRVGAKPRSYEDMDAFIGGLFAFAFADCLTRRIGGNFEVAAAVAAPRVVSASVDPRTQGDFVRELIHAFNGEGCQPVLRVMHQNLNALIRNPNSEAMDRLVGLFESSRQHAA